MNGAVRAGDGHDAAGRAGEPGAEPQAVAAVVRQQKDADAVGRDEPLQLSDGRLDALLQSGRRAQGRIDRDHGAQFGRVALPLLLRAFVLGFVPQGFDGADDASVRRLDGGRREPAPFPAVSQFREEPLGLVTALDERRLPPAGAIEPLNFAFIGLVENDVRHRRPRAVVERGPLAVGADLLARRKPRELLDGAVPVGEDVVLVDHEGRDGAALDDLVQGALLAGELELDLAGASVAAFDDGGKAVHHARQQMVYLLRVVFDALQLPVGFDLDLADHQKVPDGPGLEMVDQAHRGRLGVPERFDDGVAVGQFQEGLDVFQFEQLGVIGIGRDADGAGEANAVGLLVDVGHAQDGRALAGEDLVRQEFQECLARPAPADDRDAGAQKLSDHRSLIGKTPR